MNWRARIHVLLKPVVNDPQGQAIRGGLRSLGFDGVSQVRAGKYFEIVLDAADDDAARRNVDEMCRKLLANPVIEDYRFDLEAQPALLDAV